MKIILQTANEMAIKDSNVPGLIFGIIAAAVGIGAGGYTYFFHGSPNALWLEAIFFIAGLGILFTATTITIDINKPDNQVSYQRKLLIGGSRAIYAISDVLRIETRKQWATTGVKNNSRTVLLSQAVMVLKNGSEIPLDSQKNISTIGVGGVLMSGSGKELAIATQVASFIGVPFQEIAPPSSGMGTGINIGGI